MSKINFIIMVTILRPLRMLVTESIVLFFSIYTAFNFSVLFAFFAAFPIVSQSPYPAIQVYHFNTGESGLHLRWNRHRSLSSDRHLRDKRPYHLPPVNAASPFKQ
ncbi:hypothetical protein ABEF93_004705 [Exophiala dermatitidis]